MTSTSVPRLWRLARLSYDSVRDRTVLLYPEGAVLLNDSGRAILDLVDGRRTVGEIIALLNDQYRHDVESDVIEADVMSYLQQLADRELIHVG